MSAVRVSVDDATGVATVTMNRPQRLNALDLHLLDEMIAALARLAKDPACKALVLTGAGSAFCAGADLNTFVEVRDQKRHRDTGEQVSETMRERFNPMMVALSTMPKPVVTAINGIAAGGGAGIALAADIVLCGASGKLKVVQAQQLGIVADLGAHWLLQRLGGRAAALGATLLGETLDATRAAALGLVWEVVPDAELIARATAAAVKLTRIPADVVVATRALVDASPGAGFVELLEVERLYQRDFCSRAAFLASIEHFLGQHRRGRKDV